jgi:hypothetical protein
VGEVDQLEDAVDDRVAEGDEAVDGAVRQPDEEDVEEVARVLDEVPDQPEDDERDEPEPDRRDDARPPTAEYTERSRWWFPWGLRFDDRSSSSW